MEHEQINGYAVTIVDDTFAVAHFGIQTVKTGTPDEVRAYCNRPAEPEELKRFEVTLTCDTTNDVVNTFTWGVTRQMAYNRAVMLIEDPSWDGWSFSVAQEPTN